MKLARERRDQAGMARNENDLMDTPSSVMDTYAESFLGEAGIILLAEMEADWVRELAALGIMSFHYNSIRSVMIQAFRQRARLKEDFTRAVNVVICWSGLRWVAQYAEHTNQISQDVLDRAATRLINAFITKRLSAQPISMRRIAAISRRATLRVEARNESPWARRLHARRVNEENEREVDREHYWFDTEVLSHGFGFLGALSQASDAADRAEMLAYHVSLLSLFLDTMPKVEQPRQEVEGTPYEFDRWVLKLTAATVAQLSTENEARPFWRPIMDLGPGAHYWIESFFHEWFLTGRQFAPSLEEFGERWREMIAYSFEAATWARGTGQSYHLEDCAIEVMGLGLTMSFIAADEFIRVIQSLAPLYEKWGGEWLSHSRPLSHFGHFLCRPGGRGLLPSAIIWLNRGVQSMSEYGWQERDLADTLAGVLRVAWRHERDGVGANADLQKNFLQLLNTVCNRLNADALALRAEVSQSLSAATA